MTAAIHHGPTPDGDALGRCRYCGTPIESTAGNCPGRGPVVVFIETETFIATTIEDVPVHPAYRWGLVRPATEAR